MREPLQEDGENKDEDQGEGIHAGACSWPTGEENLGVLAPEEGHMHGRSMVHVHAGEVGRRGHSSHIVMRRFPTLHLLPVTPADCLEPNNKMKVLI